MGPTYKINLEKPILETLRQFIILFDQKLLKESWLSLLWNGLKVPTLLSLINPQTYFHTHTGIAHFLLDMLNVYLYLKIIFILLSNCFSYSYRFYNFAIAKNVALNLIA